MRVPCFQGQPVAVSPLLSFAVHLSCRDRRSDFLFRADGPAAPRIGDLWSDEEARRTVED